MLHKKPYNYTAVPKDYNEPRKKTHTETLISPPPPLLARILLWCNAFDKWRWFSLPPLLKNDTSIDIQATSKYQVFLPSTTLLGKVADEVRVSKEIDKEKNGIFMTRICMQSLI